ncbi:unnamed protein product [Caretta caretta]
MLGAGTKLLRALAITSDACDLSHTLLPVDPKATHMLSTKTRSEGRNGEERGGKDRTDTSSPHPFSLFSAGAAKRRSKNQEELLMISKKNGIRPPEKPLSVAEWEELRGEFKGISKFEDVMLEQMIKCNSSIDVAKSLLSMVAMRKGDISYNLLVKYLALCVRQEQMAEVCDVYDIMKVRFKTLETGAYSLLIKGLNGSDRWREALLLLEEIKKVMTPSKGNYGNCIKGALNNQEINLACELYHEMLAKDLIPNLDTLQVFFDTGKCVKDNQLKSELLGILLYLRENQLYPGEALMQSIKLWFESIPGEKWEGRLTTIKNSGKCPVCNQNLESINLSQEEYNALKEKIMKDVIQGTDTFRKTTPQAHSSTIRPAPFSDHHLATITVSLRAERPGPAYWHFNNSLLEDESFVTSFREFKLAWREQWRAFPSVR